MKKILLIVGLSLILIQGSANAQWRNLFDGKTFNGWTKYLGVPHQSNQGLDLPKDENGKYAKAFGINHDPLNVYSIVTENGNPPATARLHRVVTLMLLTSFINIPLKLQNIQKYKYFLTLLH
jgi:hypothetical protein